MNELIFRLYKLMCTHCIYSAAKNSPRHSGNGLTNKNIIIENVDTDPESCMSDYSEMADAIKEHLANVQIIRQEDLDSGNTLASITRLG